MELQLLKKRRLLAGLSQQSLAAKLGVSQPTYQRWESGVSPIPPAKLTKLVKVLGLGVDELEGKPRQFDYLGYDSKFEDDRRYFGEVSFHFTGGGSPFLLSISIAQRDSLAEQLSEGLRFPVITSLDNRTVVVRAEAVSDVFFSSEAYDDYGPEHDTYEHGPGIFPDDEFWEIVENLEILDMADEFPKTRVSAVLEKVQLSDEQLDELVKSGEIPEEDRSKVREEANELTQQFQALATDVTWQLSSGKKRAVYVDDDRDIFKALNELRMSDVEQMGMLYVRAERYHRTAFINPWAIDYFACPTHRFNRGMLEVQEQLIDQPGA